MLQFAWDAINRRIVSSRTPVSLLRASAPRSILGARVPIAKSESTTPAPPDVAVVHGDAGGGETFVTAAEGESEEPGEDQTPGVSRDVSDGAASQGSRAAMPPGTANSRRSRQTDKTDPAASQAAAIDDEFLTVRQGRRGAAVCGGAHTAGRSLLRREGVLGCMSLSRRRVRW